MSQTKGGWHVLGMSGPGPDDRVTVEFGRADRPGVVCALTWQGYELEVVGFRRSIDVGPPLTTRLVRSFPLAELEQLGREAVAVHMAAMEKEPAIQAAMRFVQGRELSFSGDFPDFTARPGRIGRDDLDYALVAERYVRLEPGRKNVIRRLADELNLSESSVTNLVHEARRRGLLTRSRPGRAGGFLTPGAIDLLNKSRGL